MAKRPDERSEGVLGLSGGVRGRRLAPAERGRPDVAVRRGWPLSVLVQPTGAVVRNGVAATRVGCA